MRLLLLILTVLVTLPFVGCVSRAPNLTHESYNDIAPDPVCVANEKNPIMYNNGFLSFWRWVEDYEYSLGTEGGILLTINNDKKHSKIPSDIKITHGTKEIKPLAIYLSVFDHKGDKDITSPYDIISCDVDGVFFIFTGDWQIKQSKWSQKERKKRLKLINVGMQRVQIYYLNR